MDPPSRFALHFALGLLLSMLLAPTISVYGFNEYEPAWGHGGSVQVLWWLSIGVAVCALFSVAIAVSWLAPGRSMSASAAFVSGVVFSLITILGMWIIARFITDIPGLIGLLWAFIGPAVLGVGVMRALGSTPL
jgi:hypothetical protein